MELLGRDFYECKESFKLVHEQLEQKDQIIRKQNQEINNLKGSNKKLKKELKEKLSTKDSKNSKLLETNAELENEVKQLSKITADSESRAKMLSNEQNESSKKIEKMELTIKSILDSKTELAKERDKECVIIADFCQIFEKKYV